MQEKKRRRKCSSHMEGGKGEKIRVSMATFLEDKYF